MNKRQVFFWILEIITLSLIAYMIYHGYQFRDGWNQGVEYQKNLMIATGNRCVLALNDTINLTKGV
jgi:hypothetical protein